ncbi:TPA: N-acetyl-gamma-glutamyl-phosphate reductase [archaeon]|uniref:Putative [LysW]-L-2-aminoadipate/[LysW]-L-glutamate phosphate reductase n=1 Tax=Candidatus Naiadarchaeum limnaeum TaxID=2756139 RepID=A0A832V1J2_9ARCH|nr:N-acetyl-gamma-glutamyl-phosphate reductase [Candidatus Naiadarchaeum limnaeum]
MEVAIVGASGYTGRNLMGKRLNQPEFDIKAVTSDSNAGHSVSKVHPNLRKKTELKFIKNSELGNYDLIFSAVPHGVAMKNMRTYIKHAEKIVDLSADFRLKNPKEYEKWYGHKHECPELIEKFVYGIPELHREEMKKANYISGAGCLATSAILALYPLAKEGLIETEHIVVDSKVGSSASGSKADLADMHAERANVVRAYKPSFHRHTGEMEQELNFNGNRPVISFSPHAVDLVRGILSTCHVFLNKNLTEKDIWQVYRKYYSGEPFVRIVKEKDGIYRYPEPKLLTGTNYCDVGFERDENSNRLVVMSALDNLMKGASGQAVQAMNIISGFKETEGLEFFGLHPI